MTTSPTSTIRSSSRAVLAIIRASYFMIVLDNSMYDRYGPAIVGAVIGPRAAPVTIRLVPTD